MPKRLQISASFPIDGINDNWARMAQPPLTTPSVLNMLPWDRGFRMRGGQRPGVATYSITASQTHGSGASAFIIDTKIGTTFATINFRSSNVVTPARFTNGIVYFVDGGTLKSISGTSLTDPQSVTGTAPSNATVSCMWRGRWVIGGNSSSATLSNQWTASRINNPTDFDLTRTAPDRAITHATLATNGQGSLIDPIVAIIPFSNDVMVFGHDSSIWGMFGDPTGGGTLRPITMGTGIAGANAWCIDNSGAMWFIGSGGLFRFNGASVEPMARDKYMSFFQAINKTVSSYRISMAFDRDRYGLWIFFTPTSGGPGTHLFYDIRRDAFWPIQFATATVDPYCCRVIDGPTQTDRALVLGSAGGATAYQLANSATTDIGSSISAYVWIGPIIPYGPLQEGMLETVDIVLGEMASGFDIATNAACTYTVQCADSAYKALADPAQNGVTGTISTVGRSDTIPVRYADNAFFLKLANSTASKFFSFEEAVFTFIQGGMVR